MKLFFKIIVIIGIASLTACDNPVDKKTNIYITDNNRYYYPMARGQEVKMQFEIRNTGESLLHIKDIISSCGCILIDKETIHSILPGKKGVVSIKFDTTKGKGEMTHYIALYANLEDQKFEEIVFHTHVVSNSDYRGSFEDFY